MKGMFRDVLQEALKAEMDLGWHKKINKEFVASILSLLSILLKGKNCRV